MKHNCPFCGTEVSYNYFFTSKVNLLCPNCKRYLFGSIRNKLRILSGLGGFLGYVLASFVLNFFVDLELWKRLLIVLVILIVLILILGKIESNLRLNYFQSFEDQKKQNV
jgi:hypothetical protein